MDINWNIVGIVVLIVVVGIIMIYLVHHFAGSGETCPVCPVCPTGPSEPVGLTGPTGIGPFNPSNTADPFHANTVIPSPTDSAMHSAQQRLGRNNCLLADCSHCVIGWGPPGRCDELLDTQVWNMIQQRDSGERFLILRKEEDTVVKRAQKYYGDIPGLSPADRIAQQPELAKLQNTAQLTEINQTITVTGDLRDYKTEVVAPSMQPWSFEVFNQPGPGRIEWCVWTPARKNPSFIIRKGQACQTGYRLGELLVYRFWAHDQLAPDLTWVRVEQNQSDPSNIRYRLRPANQSLEPNWIPIDRIVVTKFHWG